MLEEVSIRSDILCPESYGGDSQGKRIAVFAVSHSALLYKKQESTRAWNGSI